MGSLALRGGRRGGEREGLPSELREFPAIKSKIKKKHDQVDFVAGCGSNVGRRHVRSVGDVGRSVGPGKSTDSGGVSEGLLNKSTINQDTADKAENHG